MAAQIVKTISQQTNCALFVIQMLLNSIARAFCGHFTPGFISQTRITANCNIGRYRQI